MREQWYRNCEGVVHPKYYIKCSPSCVFCGLFTCLPLFFTVVSLVLGQSYDFLIDLRLPWCQLSKYEGYIYKVYPWWRHQMETFSALLALCAGIHRSSVNSPHKVQWRGALMFSLTYAWKNGWVNNRKAGVCDAIALIMTSLYCNAVTNCNKTRTVCILFGTHWTSQDIPYAYLLHGRRLDYSHSVIKTV